ncbi:moonshiner [Drosophila tropicalis]|uniref:moonshiner n=1 Tax=Drosophila tropicalis TaxID=46794 RepID=UPI0035ABB7DA
MKWRNKFKPIDRQPTSNSRPVTPPPPRKRRKGNPITNSLPVSEFEPEPLVDLNETDDNEIIINRICIPRLRPSWTTRKFDICVPARAVKYNLLSSMFNWEMLERIMELPEIEAKNMLQNCVDEHLQNEFAKIIQQLQNEIEAEEDEEE